MRGLIAAVFALFLGSAQASAEERIALVIGNADYDRNGVIDMSQAAYDAAMAQHFASDLANPVNDARLVRDVLTRAGYDVTYGENLDLGRLADTVRAFGVRAEAAPPDARVIVYYAGHALKVETMPYFVPVGARMPDSLPPGSEVPGYLSPELEIELYKFTHGLSGFLTRFSARSNGGFNLVFWDACRSDPWWRVGARGGAFAAITSFIEEKLMEGTKIPRMPATSVVVFSAMDDALDGDGANSPFAAALAQNLGREGLRMSDMLGETRTTLRRTTRGAQDMLVLLEDTGSYVRGRQAVGDYRSYLGKKEREGKEALEVGIPPTVCVVSCPTP